MVKDPTLRLSEEPGSYFPGVLLGTISNKELNGFHHSIVDMVSSHRSILSLYPSGKMVSNLFSFAFNTVDKYTQKEDTYVIHLFCAFKDL